MDDIIKNNPEVSLIPFKEVEEKIVVVRDQKVLLDRDLAELYGVETKRINEAVRNNPRKFREGYMFELTSEESSVLRSKFSTLEQTNGKGRHSKYNFKPDKYLSLVLWNLSNLKNGRLLRKNVKKQACFSPRCGKVVFLQYQNVAFGRDISVIDT